MTRCLQKFAYGTPAMLKLMYPEFYTKYEGTQIVKDGANYVIKQKLTGDWFKDKSFENIDKIFNFDQARNVTSNLTMGMRQ